MNFNRIRTLGTRTLAALLAAGMPAAAVAAGKSTIVYAEHPYTLASPCNLAQPLVFLNLLLHNGLDTPTGPVRLTAEDDAHVFEGDTTLPQVPANTQLPATFALRRKASSPGPLAGTHTIAVTASLVGSSATYHVTPLAVAVPATFCVTAAATAAPTTPSAGAPGAVTPIRPRAPMSAILATPTVIKIGKNGSNVQNIVMLVRPAVPTNVRNVGSGPDCGAHVGLLGAIACPAMIASGNLLLIWDWKSDGALADVDGYRTYRVDSGLKQLVYTTNNKKDLTLVDIAPPAGGYTGKCYAVSAYTAKAESELSSAFCASGGAVTKTAHLSASQARSKNKVSHDGGNFVTGTFTTSNRPTPETAVMVGFEYVSEKHTLGDQYTNEIFRAAVAFDVSTLSKRRLVSAKLHLTIADSRGRGNNYSCITNIGTGTEFWWRNTDWPEVQSPDIEPNDVGPEITADVTKLVAPWLQGEPNYGFVLLNRDERLGTFDNRQCQSSYTNPILEITYY